MKLIQRIILILIILYMSTAFSGCYDYSEINDLEFIAGFAIDKVKNSDEYLITFEMLEPSQDQKTMSSKIVKAQAKTIHEAIRDTVETTGKMVEGAHVETVIISKEIAEEGIIPVIDFINRDVEIRADIHLFISKNYTAGEILENNKNDDNVISFELAKSQVSQKNLGKYVSVRLYELIDILAEDQASPAVASVELNSEGILKIEGTAVFKKDKLVGFLNGDESLYLLIIKNVDMNSVLVIPEKDMKITLEIIKIKSKVKSEVTGDSFEIFINSDINTVISELGCTNIDLNNESILKIKTMAEIMTKSKIMTLVKKVQKQYGSDIFGFSGEIKREHPKKWKQMQHDYEKIFPNMKVTVNVNINIKGSALHNKEIKLGDVYEKRIDFK